MKLHTGTCVHFVHGFFGSWGMIKWFESYYFFFLNQTHLRFSILHDMHINAEASGWPLPSLMSSRIICWSWPTTALRRCIHYPFFPSGPCTDQSFQQLVRIVACCGAWTITPMFETPKSLSVCILNKKWHLQTKLETDLNLWYLIMIIIISNKILA